MTVSSVMNDGQSTTNATRSQRARSAASKSEGGGGGEPRVKSRARALSSSSSSYSSSTWSSAASSETLRRLRQNDSATVSFEDQFCGWLWMRGSKIGRWRHRYFCLSGTLLSYFMTFPSEEFLRQAKLPENVCFSDGTVPRGVLRVAHVEESDSKSLGFRLFGTCGRSIEIRAHRVDERNEWLRALKTPARRKSRSWSTGSAEELTLSLASFDPDSLTCSIDRQSVAIHKSGWLLKRSDVLKRWNRYFFVLQGKMLSYYASDKPYEVPRRRGYVHGTRITRSRVGANGFYPDLAIELDNQSVLHVRFSCEEEMEEWRELLLDCTISSGELSGTGSSSGSSISSLIPLL